MNNYIKIKNNDNKVWILPKSQLKVALNLYQPTSLKGILLKKFLPYIEKIGVVAKIFNKILKIEECDYYIEEEVDKIVRTVFKLENDMIIYYSFFLGTPCVDQKTTIQIHNNNKILGYCKLSEKENVINLFYGEKKLLDYFKQKNIKNIPKCLFCGRLEDNKGVFIQDTKKNNNSKIVHNITNEHISFIKMFCDKTEIKCKYEETDYYKLMKQMEENYILLEKIGYNTEIIKKTKTRVEEYLKKEKAFSSYHGDFTPWNTFFNKDEIFVFDFEYAKSTFPKYIDIFHFYTQVLIYKKNMKAEEIYEDFKKFSNNNFIKCLFTNIVLEYEIYLLAIIAFYLNRDKKDLTTTNNIKIWINLLMLLYEK